MLFYLFSTIIPIGITFLTFICIYPKNFKQFVKAYNYSLLGVFLYLIIIYLLKHLGVAIDTWAIYSILVFMIPAIFLFILFNLIILIRRF